MVLKLLVKFESATVAGVRCYHHINIAQGGGGRSSYSGVSATVFGSTGTVGRVLTNHLAACGTQLILPFRGEEKRVLPMRVMADLGQMMFRPHTIKDREDNDAYTRELIQFSNTVINCIGSNRRFHHYTMEEVNLEWPVRLAELVADKDDGTTLVHITNLACNRPEARAHSKLLSLQHEAEQKMREIYPNTIVVRSAPVYGKRDNFLNLLLSKRWKDLGILGAIPCLHGGGRSTTIQPVYVSDLAKAMTIIVKEPGLTGETFEFVGKDRFLLADAIEYMYELPVQDEIDYCLHDAIGPLDGRNASIAQKIAKLYLSYFFRRQYRPSLLPLPLDLIFKGFNRTTWMSEERFKMLHMSDHITGENPGFEDLGIHDLTDFEQKVYDLMYAKRSHPTEYVSYTEANPIPRASKNDLVIGKKPAQAMIAAAH